MDPFTPTRLTLCHGGKRGQNGENSLLRHILLLNFTQHETSSSLLCLFLIHTVCKPCQDGWLLFQSKCYLFTVYDYYSEWNTWEESQKRCREQTADLVVIESQEEQVRCDFNSISFVFFLLEWSLAAVFAENFIKCLSEILIIDFISNWIHLKLGWLCV